MATDNFTVRTEPEKIEKIAAIAKNLNQSTDELVNRVLDEVLAEQQELEEQVRAGREAFARGEFVTHEEAMAELREHIEAQEK